VVPTVLVLKCEPAPAVLLLVLDPELFGGVASDDLFLVMLRARTLPRAAVLWIELARERDDVELPLMGI
jgi:hypothetical protein